MKHYFLLYFLSIMFRTSAFAQSPSLEIHHIGAGDGDATLIMIVDSTGKNAFTGLQNWDTTVMLIDVQRYGSGGTEIFRYIKDTVGTRFPGRKKIDHVFITHLHIDHYGGMVKFLEAAGDAGWKIGDVYDRQNVNYQQYFQGTTIVDDCYDDVEEPAGTSYNKYYNALKNNNLLPTKSLSIGQNMVENYKTAYVFCVVGYGFCASVKSDKDTCFLPTKTISSKKYFYAKSENDLSIGFLIRFQGFNYLTTGDLGGISGGNYVDGETPVTKGIMSGLRYPTGYHLCANKVSHHGSEESSTNWFVTTNDFTVSVIPACLRSYGSSSNALPTQTAITNLQSTGTNNLFYTFVPKNPQTASSYWTKGDFAYYNDVVIKFTSPPGYDDVAITIIQRKKTKKYVYTGSATKQTVNCTKNHDW